MSRTPYEEAERKADVEYITDLIENKSWPEILDGLEKYIELRETRQEMFGKDQSFNQDDPKPQHS